MPCHLNCEVYRRGKSRCCATVLQLGPEAKRSYLLNIRWSASIAHRCHIHAHACPVAPQASMDPWTTLAGIIEHGAMHAHVRDRPVASRHCGPLLRRTPATNGRAGRAAHGRRHARAGPGRGHHRCRRTGREKSKPPVRRPERVLDRRPPVRTRSGRTT